MTSQLFYVSNYSGSMTPLADADAACAGATPKGTLVLDYPDTVTSGGLTLSSPRVIGGGGLITLNGTLTINGALSGTGQIFLIGTSNAVVLGTGVAVDVTWFGAVGSGTLGTANGTNAPINTAAFGAALACVEAYAYGGELYVPPGVYDIGDPATGTVALNAVSGSAVTIRGAGRRASLLQSNLSSGKTMLNIGATGSTQGVNLVDMGFTSAATASSMTVQESTLVELSYCLDGRVERCSFLGGYITQLQIARPQGMQILDCDFRGPDQSAGNYCASYGVVFTADANNHAGQAARIQNCTIRDFRNSTHSAIAVNFEIQIIGGSPIGPGAEFAVVDCDIENSDLCVNDNTGTNRFIRNSMESGVTQFGITASANTGTGTLALAGTPLNANAQTGTYRVVYNPSPANNFTVYDPTNLVLGTAVAGTAFTGEVNFTITAGGTGFAAGDKFTIEVTNPAMPTAVVANPINSVAGTLTVQYTEPGDPPVAINNGDYVNAFGTNGTFYLVCTTAGGTGTGVFTVYDPMGNVVGTATVGTAFTLPPYSGATWTVLIATAGSFTTGDNFTIVGFVDTLFRIGNEFNVSQSIYAQNTLSMDGVNNAKFFDCVNYRYIEITDNVFTNPSGYMVYCGWNNFGVLSMLRHNQGIDPRTAMYLHPGLVDGQWVALENIERAANWTDTAPAGATAPSVANLQTLLLANTAATAITNFTGGYNGQEICVIADEAPLNSSFQTGPNLIMNSGGTEMAFGNTAYTFRATVDPSSTTPVWRQTGPFPRPALQNETTLYLAAGTLAGAAAYPLQFQYAVDDLVIALKAYGLWSTFDGFWLFAVNDVDLTTINLVAPGDPAHSIAAKYPITWTGALTFTPYFGVTGASGVYGAPASMARNALSNYGVNSGALTIWSLSNVTATTYAIGTSTGGVARIAPRVSTLHVISGDLNDGTLFNSSTSNAEGLTSLIRTFPGSVATRTAYRNGLQAGNDTGVADTGVGADVFYILRDLSTYHVHPIAMAAIGGGRSATDEANLYTAVQAFMRKVGVVAA